MNSDNSIIYDHLQRRVTIFHYLWLLWLFTGDMLFFRKKIILSLPLEVQYPYIYYHWENGLAFIKFAERLKKFFHLNLYWTNSSLSERIENGSHLTISWDFIPKNIHLLINSKLIKRGKNQLSKLLQLRQGLVKFI